ncbi:MAG TPA: maltose alpha-D-glucosyltransferase [Vicinamibacterales bacterium]|nr:maltose alpha-D-glucosyltransferase [Vicinamibacterales bacterium]
MSEPLWYKDAVIYELHVKAFLDSNADGSGDFTGLTQKLDYIQALGVNCIWLLPFYPSPLRDDGYDIAWYQGVHPSYGTLRDFRRFLDEAHRRNLYVLTELVVNHSSDQHPWFKRARKLPPGSREREYYVWSDTKQRYEDARIIFTDSETSNWTWDPDAKAYYWHRFFHHQPDLNFDNPEVRRRMRGRMDFWLGMGVDGLRLDAVPYLIEREGTSCENLSETHEILKDFRAHVDSRYSNRMLLAEANQWPADVRPYFGDGDECHMALHFPLMPRMFMALQQEDRHPITEILHQTPDIPDNCQWALFLRNHDELTLEMVTDEERDYMYNAYAADPRMRLNLGIRRRLAPLAENSRRRIELLHGLLFSLPGTPILYYGDEIGMGDNIYLGDRNGVRTPMQWTSDRNAGFSRADPAALYAPPIMDPVYGYQAINVEAQERSPHSLLQWMRRMLALRQQHKVFGRGTTRFLQPANRKVLVYVREGFGKQILVAANLARSLQPLELDLSEFKGLYPVEMLGRTEFPRIGDLPYFLTLGPNAFYWFELVEQPEPISARVAPAQPAESPVSFPALLAGGAWETLLEGNVRNLVERECLPQYLQRQRWFAGKSRTMRSAKIVDWALVRKGRDPAFLAIVEVTFTDEERERYLMPLATEADGRAAEVLAHSPETVIARLTGARKGVLYDGCTGEKVGRETLALIAGNRAVQTRHGVISGQASSALEALAREVDLGGLKPSATRREQSNSSLIFDDALILKLIRRLDPGHNPELEISFHLTERARFQRVPPFEGSLHYQGPGTEPVTLGILHRLVPHQADGWGHAIEELGRYFERVASEPDLPPEPPAGASAFGLVGVEVPTPIDRAIGGFRETASRLGRRTAELHLALASAHYNPAFTPEPFTSRDLALTAARMAEEARSTLEVIEQALPSLPERSREPARRLVDQRDAVVGTLAALSAVPDPGEKVRVHGDYHLGQVLWAEGDFYILDFEGEPDRPLAERRARQSPMKDVAGMLRSYSYASWVALRSQSPPPGGLTGLQAWAAAWRAWVSAEFLRSYLDTARDASFLPHDRNSLHALLRVFLLEKALYELRYELNHRPDWLAIPLAGIHEILGW